MPLHTGDAGWVKWKQVVGEVYNSSPVIGKRGQVIVATLAAKVFAFTPDGKDFWDKDLTNVHSDMKIRSSPAIDLDGYVYVIGHSSRGDPPQPRSELIKLDRTDGHVVWFKEITDKETPSTGWTLASPKLVPVGMYSSFIFVHARDDEFSKHSLRIFNSSGDLISTLVLPCLPPNNSPNLSDSVPVLPDPTPAVVEASKIADRFDLTNFDNGTFGSDTQYEWLIVIANNQCAIGAYLWDPHAMEQFKFKQLWSIDDPNDVLYTSPLVTPDGAVVFGTSDGNVHAHDLVTGAEFWTPPVHLDGQIWEPPASFMGGWIFTYIATTTNLYKLRNNGTIDNSVPLPPKVRATPATTHDRVYVNSGTGLHTFAFDFSSTTVSPDGASKNQFTSPSIGPDGTIYVVAADGNLVAYYSGAPE
jgi:outer membrane protein assembly factor BamB